MLGNAYKEYCAADAEKRERVLRHWVRNWFSVLRDMPEDFEDVKPDLLPIVRSRSHFELNQLRSLVESGTPISWPYVPLGEHFGVALVYDLPDAMRSIPQANLDAWGLTLYEALEIARENLAALPAKFIGPQSGEGVYLSATGDNYDASRILSPELIGQFQVKGDPVAMIANRDNLIVAGADDAESGLDAMLKMAAEALEQLRPISSVAVRFDGEEWVPWLPEAAHPLHKQFRRFYFDAVGRDYAEQKELLDRLHAKTNKNIFVATFNVVQDPQGRLLSYAVWTESVESLLPQTDMVVFGGLEGEPTMVPWSKAHGRSRPPARTTGYLPAPVLRARVSLGGATGRHGKCVLEGGNHADQSSIAQSVFRARRARVLSHAAPDGAAESRLDGQAGRHGRSRRRRRHGLLGHRLLGRESADRQQVKDALREAGFDFGHKVLTRVELAWNEEASK